MMKKIYPLYSLCVLAVLSAMPVDAADLVLRDRVNPAGAVIRLGEVAEVLRATPQETARLASLPLMPAPAPGTQQFIRAQEIRDLLVAVGEDLNQLRFDGANRVVIGREVVRAAAPEAPVAKAPPAVAPLAAAPVRPRQQTGYRLVSEAPPRRTRSKPVAATPGQIARIKDGLKSQLSQYVQQQTGDKMLHVLSVDLLTRNANHLARATGPIEIVSTEPIAIGRQRFLISFTAEDGPVRFPVFTEVHLATPVVVAAQPIARGSVITAAALRLEPLTEERRINSSETPFVSIEAVLGKEAGEAIRPGDPLTDGNCLPPLMVRRGEIVNVVAGGGGVRVTRRTKAKTNGRLGETIMVETLEGRQRMEARVVGYGELAILSEDSGANGYLSSAPGARRIR